MIGGRLALHLGQIPILAVVALGRAFDEFEEMTQVLALGGFEFRKFDAYAKGRTALGNNPSENDAFDPDLPIGQPETDFHAYSGGYGRCSLDETSPETGIGEISPDWDCGVTQLQLNRDEAPHASMASAILAPGWGENVRFEWRTGGRAGCHRRCRHRLRRCCGFGLRC